MPPDWGGGDRPGDARPASVPITAEVSEDVRIVTASGTLRCAGPCTLTVPTGFVRVTVGDRTEDLFLERPSRLEKSPGAPGLRTAGLGLLAGGALVVAAAIVVPLLVCQTEYPKDAMGAPLPSRNPCRDLSDGVKIAWIAGAGIGLTAATFGAITYAAASPRLSLTPSDAPREVTSTARATVRVVPWLAPSSATERAGSAAFGGAGALVVGTF